MTKRRRIQENFSDKLDTFVQWVVSLGGNLSNLKFEPTTDVFGNPCVRSIAREDISLASEIGSIPNSLIVSIETITPSLSKICPREVLTDLSSSSILSLFLILCRHSEDDLPFRPYVDILPELFTALPYNWPESLWKNINSSSLQMVMQKRKDLMFSDYQNLESRISRTGDKKLIRQLNWSRYLWARCVLMTRFISCGTCPAGAVEWIQVTSNAFYQCWICLIMIQMLKSIGFPQRSGLYFIEARTRLKKGDIVMNNYGRKTNEELLLGYGFAVEINPHLHLSFQLSNGATLRVEAKRRFEDTCHAAAREIMRYKYPDLNMKSPHGSSSTQIPDVAKYRNVLQFILDEIVKLSESRDKLPVLSNPNDPLDRYISLAIRQKHKIIDTLLEHLAAGLERFLDSVSILWSRRLEPRNIGSAPWTLSYLPSPIPLLQTGLFPSGWIDNMQASDYLDKFCDVDLLDSMSLHSSEGQDENGHINEQEDMSQIFGCSVALLVACSKGALKLSPEWLMNRPPLDDTDLFYGVDSHQLGELVGMQHDQAASEFVRIVDYCIENAFYECDPGSRAIVRICLV